jgi:hypothetical protein
MKIKLNLVVLAVSITLLLCGCAQVGPSMVSPEVYKSSRDNMVSQNQLRKERAETGRSNEGLNQKMIGEWEKVALAEIQGKTTNGGNKSITITDEGVLGGFPCIFINDSWINKTLTIQKIGGFLDGHKWDFELMSHGGLKRYKLPPGRYNCWWATEYSDQKYPSAGPDSFPVTVVPHFYYSKLEEDFHGGYRLRGGY